MDNLGSEVGQKMRGAIKAKLIELGSGESSGGYIDDELPDYVMIMVANKRSKEQMIEDLRLFLSSNTESFVSWLHQVLEKLEEVTVPVSLTPKNKRKSSDSIDVAHKKDKKDRKKDKKVKRIQRYSYNTTKETQNTRTPIQVNIPFPSITDVFADQLIQKSKRALETEISIKAKLEKAIICLADDDFDIPTISEIAENAVEEVVRRKELTDLEELQKKIKLAKKQLRALTSDDSDDSDFLNLRDDSEDFNATFGEVRKITGRNPSPIAGPLSLSVANAHTPALSERSLNLRASITFDENPLPQVLVKKSLADRLGTRKKNVINLSLHRRSEQEIYVPKARRKEANAVPIHIVEHKKPRISIRHKKDPSELTEPNRFQSIRHRIGSQVVIAPARDSFEEDEIAVPVNSVVKVKPRPVVPINKQANKNLLLRAVAEAQKSTASAVPIRRSPPILWMRRSSPIPVLKRLDARPKILVKVPNDERRESGNEEHDCNDNGENTNEKINIPEEEQEYVPKSIDHVEQSDLLYRSQSKSSSNGNELPPEKISCDKEENSTFSEKINRRQTQFVVTLGGIFRRKPKSTSEHRRRDVTPVVIKKSVDQIVDKTRVESSLRFLHQAKRESQAASPQSPALHKQPSPVKKLIINLESDCERTPEKPATVKDKWSEEESSDEKKGSTTPPMPQKLKLEQKEMPVLLQSETSFVVARKIRNRSPIRFDLKDSPKPAKVETRENSFEISDEEVPLIEEHENWERHFRKIDVSKKYDDVPPLLSIISVGADNSKSKLKERCKYYPSCSKGDLCEFVHPSMVCKSFPNCKFTDKCLYTHPKCKFDLSCSRTGCPFSHTATQSLAPPLASHVVPVQNYKTIVAAPLPVICKFYPNCTNNVCTFFHPKICRYGKNCTNRVECNFFHHETPTKDKFKWISPMTV